MADDERCRAWRPPCDAEGAKDLIGDGGLDAQVQLATGALHGFALQPGFRCRPDPPDLRHALDRRRALRRTDRFSRVDRTT